MKETREQMVDGVYETALHAMYRLKPRERVDVLMSLSNAFCATCGKDPPCGKHGGGVLAATLRERLAKTDAMLCWVEAPWMMVRADEMRTVLALLDKAPTP